MLKPAGSAHDIQWRPCWVTSSHRPRSVQFSDDLDYWRSNAYPVAFQNHRAGFVVSGRRIAIDGHGTGGIDGNGDAWYGAEQATTLPGRPMPFVFWNASDVKVEHCAGSPAHEKKKKKRPLPWAGGQTSGAE